MVKDDPIYSSECFENLQMGNKNCKKFNEKSVRKD
jgi:hypothetical protein